MSNILLMGAIRLSLSATVSLLFRLGDLLCDTLIASKGMDWECALETRNALFAAFGAACSEAPCHSLIRLMSGTPCHLACGGSDSDNVSNASSACDPLRRAEANIPCPPDIRCNGKAAGRRARGEKAGGEKGEGESGEKRFWEPRCI